MPTWSAEGRPRLRLVLFNHLARLPFPCEEMTAEVSRIVEGVGVEVVWRTPGKDDTTPPEIPVTLLATPPARSGLPAAVMGAVQSDRAAPRSVWVFLSNVARALGGAPHPGDLAQATGRVIAHELTHTMAPELPHAGAGS